MIIDNIDIIREHLTFLSDFDRYIIHIIKRAKDDKGRTYGVNETNRLIKTFYISSLEYYDRKIPVIKDLCKTNNARAYILPQVRNNSSCMKEMLKLIVDNLDNPTIKPDHLIRSAYCGYHGSRDKKWILDLDGDNMIEYRNDSGGENKIWREIKWHADEVLEFIQNQLVEIGKRREDAWMIPTRSGHCIVTSPFNLQDTYDKCRMCYQGIRKKCNRGEQNHGTDDIVGWVIKDGMALLYMEANK